MCASVNVCVWKLSGEVSLKPTPCGNRSTKNYHYKGYGRLCECSIHFIVIDASYVVASDLVQTPVD